jgi:hypothetical protein
MIMGNDVPMASDKRKEDVLPANAAWAKAEKRKADSPKPEITIELVVPR